jgi:hydrogenase nickel incorporation protein HypB
VLLSVTGGEDKPLNYPGIFHRASLMILTKTDLLCHVEFNVNRKYTEGASEIPCITLSSRTGEGFDKWLTWLNALQQEVQQEAAAASS